MGLFKRKKESLEQCLDSLPRCPPLQDVAKWCACATCPKKGTCPLELVHHLLDCRQYIRTCSLKNTIVSPNKVSDFPKIALDEFYTHIYLKYLDCNNPGELKEEEIKSAEEKSN